VSGVIAACSFSSVFGVDVLCVSFGSYVRGVPDGSVTDSVSALRVVRRVVGVDWGLGVRDVSCVSHVGNACKELVLREVVKEPKV
jgi:hypothetical protein